MNLTEIFAAAQIGDGRIQANIGADWLQGRSLFGGIQAAIGWRAMRTLVPEAMPLRTLQMTFIEPVPDGSVAATARVLRASKNTMHVEARLEHDGALLATLIAVFGATRESIVQRELPRPPAPTLDIPLRFVAGVMPSFMQQFDARLVGGAPPFSGKHVDNTGFELGLHDSGAVTEAHLLLFADFVPPVALSWMTKPSSGSSLTWMFEVFGDDFGAQPMSGWRIASEMVAARGGYTSQSSTLWAPDGAAVALSRQSMVVFG